MKLLGDYFRIKKEIHDYFGYAEDWVTIPLDDARGTIGNLMVKGMRMKGIGMKLGLLKL